MKILNLGTRIIQIGDKKLAPSKIPYEVTEEEAKVLKANFGKHFLFLEEVKDSPRADVEALRATIAQLETENKELRAQLKAKADKKK